HSHTIAISGGAGKTQFYLAGNIYNEEGTIEFNSNQKYNFRTNITHSLNEKLKLGVRVNASYDKQKSDPSGLGGALYGAYTNIPWDKPYSEDGIINRGTEGGWFGREQENFLHGWQYNLN